MTILVIAEHDNASLKGATLNTVTAAHRSCGGDVHVLVAGHNARRRRARPPRKIAGVAKVLHRRRAAARARPGRERRRAGAGRRRQDYTPHPVRRPPPTARTSRRAWPPSSTSRRSPTSPRSIARHLRAPDLRRQRDRHRADRRDAIKVITVRTTGFDPAPPTGGNAPRSRRSTPSADRGKSQLRRPRGRPRSTGPN